MNRHKTDDKAKRKIHPRAMDCLIISLAPLVPLLLALALAMTETYEGNPFDKGIMALLFISILAQPCGIFMGIVLLFQIRKNQSYCGKGYVIAGIIISTTLIFLLLTYFVTMTIYAFNLHASP